MSSLCLQVGDRFSMMNERERDDRYRSSVLVGLECYKITSGLRSLRKRTSHSQQSTLMKESFELAKHCAKVSEGNYSHFVSESCNHQCPQQQN